MKFTIKQVLHANKIQAEVIGELRSKIAALEDACHSHACPDDGSTDTVCWPDNHKCPARRLGGERPCGCGLKGCYDIPELTDAEMARAIKFKDRKKK